MGVLRTFNIAKTDRLPPTRRSELKRGSEVWVHNVFGDTYKVNPAVVVNVARSAAEVKILIGHRGKNKAYINFSRLSLRDGTEYEPVVPEDEPKRRIVHPAPPRRPPAPVMPAIPPRTPPKAANGAGNLTHRPLSSIATAATYANKEPSMTAHPHVPYPSGLQLRETALVIGRPSSKNDEQRGVDRYAYIVISEESGMTVRTVARRRATKWEPASQRKTINSLPDRNPVLLLTSLQDYGDLLVPDLRELVEDAYLELQSEIEERRTKVKLEKTREDVQKAVATMTDEQLAKMAKLLGR